MNLDELKIAREEAMSALALAKRAVEEEVIRLEYEKTGAKEGDIVIKYGKRYIFSKFICQYDEARPVVHRIKKDGSAHKGVSKFYTYDKFEGK